MSRRQGAFGAAFPILKASTIMGPHLKRSRDATLEKEKSIEPGGQEGEKPEPRHGHRDSPQSFSLRPSRPPDGVRPNPLFQKFQLRGNIVNGSWDFGLRGGLPRVGGPFPFPFAIA